MISEYLTAAQAKQLVEDANSLTGTELKQETLAILDKIGNTAAMGKTSFTNSGSIQEIVLKRLRALGYTVKCNHDQRDGYWVVIAW